ncbi:MAG: hypothetical protein IPI67_31395 [Myxococcales bacterium]|nr:hypothetical protein [Myxococcales bacterium]
MTFTPKPCAHCGGQSFHLVPNLQLEFWQPTTTFGVRASQKATGGARWTMTLLICTHCGKTETFTVNAAELCRHVQGSTSISS